MDGLVTVNLVEDSKEVTLHKRTYVYHVYCAIWSVVVGEILQYERKLDNVEDCYALSMG